MAEKIDLTNIERILKDIHTSITSPSGGDKSTAIGKAVGEGSKKGTTDRLMTKKELVDALKEWSRGEDFFKKNNARNLNSLDVSSLNKAVSDFSKAVGGLTKSISNLGSHIQGIPVSNAGGARNSADNGKYFNDDTVKGQITSIADNVRDILGIMSSQSGGDAAVAQQEISDFEKKRELFIKLGKTVNNGNAETVKKGSKEEKKQIKDYHKAEREEKRRRELIKYGGRGGRFLAAAGGIAKGAVGAAETILTEKPTVGKMADKAIGAVSSMGPVGGVIGGILSLAKSVIALGNKYDRMSTDYVRAIGGGGEGKEAAIAAVRQMVREMPKLGNYTSDAAFSAMTEVAEARGRSTEHLSGPELQSAIDLKRFGIGADAIRNFDTFGKSLEQTDKYFARLYGEVSKKGLSFRNVSKAVNDNLKMAQAHNFANGLRGLERMAEKSTQLKYNMQQVSSFADRVDTVEGAISAAANLSVLGGQFAQFSNPMQLLYEGLNDMEALNDRMVEMFSGKAYWDSSKGEMTIDPLTKRMMQEAAKGIGLDPGEMIQLSMNEGVRRRVEKQIAPGTEKQTAEYIKNLGELDENGQAYISIDGKKHFLNADYAKSKGEEALTSDKYEELQKESLARAEKDGAKLGDIYIKTASLEDKLNSILQYLQEKIGMWVAGLFNRFVGKANEYERTAQGSGSEALKELRLRYFREEKDKHGSLNILGKSKGQERFAEEVAGKSENWLKKYFEDKERAQAKPKASAGINPSLLVPGMGGMIVGPSHFNGGVDTVYGNKPYEMEGGEFVVNKASSLRYGDILPKIQNGTFNPYSYSNDIIRNDMKRHYQPMSLRDVAGGIGAETSQRGAAFKNVSGTIKVDIPRTITLNIAGGPKIGDYDVSTLVSKYVDAFMKEALMRQDISGFNKENFYNKGQVI